ncbi:MAG: hypothetical protein HY720_31080 [Planctomycetes bacterium]|nr:hypothetical protein [Planctomycetota bacterium]
MQKTGLRVVASAAILVLASSIAVLSRSNPGDPRSVAWADEEGEENGSLLSLVRAARDGDARAARELAEAVEAGGPTVLGAVESREILAVLLGSDVLRTYYHDDLARIVLGGLHPGDPDFDLGFARVPLARAETEPPPPSGRGAGEAERVLYADLALSVRDLVVLCVRLPAEGVWGTAVLAKKDGRWSVLATYLPEH